MNKPLILTTPKGTAQWPYLTEPDIEFNPDGLFHTKLSCKKSESVNIKKAIDDMIAQEIKRQHDKDPNKAITKSLPYTEEGDDIIFNFKMNAKGPKSVFIFPPHESVLAPTSGLVKFKLLVNVSAIKNYLF